MNPEYPIRLLDSLGLPVDGSARILSDGVGGTVWRLGDLVIKTNPTAPDDLFSAEAQGLKALSCAGASVPNVLGTGPDYIIMEYLSSGPDCSAAMGTMVGRLHLSSAAQYGWSGPVFLGRYAFGAMPLSRNWTSFWVRHRMAPLLQSLQHTLIHLSDRIARLLETYSPPVEGPCLIHGDLWSGNRLMTNQGPALIDPSAWWGERAVDLAMMKLFGGFGPIFWKHYEDIYPIPARVHEAIPYYQLYYLLVHVLFFGSSYIPSVEGVLETYGQ